MMSLLRHARRARSRRAWLAQSILASCWLLGCSEPTAVVVAASPPGPAVAAVPPPSAPATATATWPDSAAFDWAPFRGKCIVVQGYAGGGAKTGARLQGSDWSIALELDSATSENDWWALPPGALVSAQGTVTEERDPRVFVQQPGEPITQGIPVPEGVDLAEASKRYVLRRARAQLLRTVAEVETALHAEVGRDVRLVGVVWSLNDHWWFRHDGVDLHIEAFVRLPRSGEMHGRAVTLGGRLERRAMPRLDQITIKAEPDLAEAFVLVVNELGAAPASAIRECPSPASAPRTP